MVVAYYVTLETREKYGTDEYAAIAGALVNALQNTLADKQKFQSLMHSTDLSDARVEVEVAQVEAACSSTIAARCIVQAESTSKLNFDKTLFTNMIRSLLEFPVTITKRVVKEEDYGESTSQ